MPRPIPQNIEIVHTWNGWLNNSFNKTLVQDDKLQIGGWGDNYASLVRFDLTGLPTTVDNAGFCLWGALCGVNFFSALCLVAIVAYWL